MLQELIMAAQSVSALSTLLKSANGLSNYNEIVAAVSEVNAKLLAANSMALSLQSEKSSLSAEINKLKEEVVHLKNWDAEREKYTLQAVGPGIFAYVQKGFVGNFEEAHKLCANCFDQYIKSTLQSERVDHGRQHKLVCHRCKGRTDLAWYLKT
ncbi:MAG TPA: hypothetical protein VD999_07650 [Vitreimonas sp.]|nr:hypothetical protein [Vitreimonas sp.]